MSIHNAERKRTSDTQMRYTEHTCINTHMKMISSVLSCLHCDIFLTAFNFLTVCKKNIL